jgi:hypothetical protein
MKRNVFLLASLLVVGLLVSSCQVTYKKDIKVSKGTIVNWDDVPEFDRVVVEAACDVKFVQSDELRKVETKSRDGDARLLESVVEDGVLHVRCKEENLQRIKGKHMSVTIYSPDLIGLELKGAGEVEIDELDTDTLTIEMRGAGDVDLGNIVCDRLDTRLHGAGSIKIESLTTQWADIELKGVGNVDVGFVNSGNVKCSLKGVGNVKLYGDVRHLEREAKGTGNVDVSELRIKEK